VKGGIKVSEAELEQAFVARREEARAAWALIDVGALATGVTATDDEVQSYLKDHQSEFKQPDRRRVQYVTFPPKDFRPQVAEAEVEKYYTEHAQEFATPRQVRASHLLVAVPQTGGSEAEDKARAKVADVIKRVKAGEDFGKLAAEISEDPGSKSKGGELGWVKKGEMVPQFEEALFNLKQGELTAEPVRSPFGYHAIKALEVKAESRKPLREVASVIRERLAGEAADKAARARADEVKPQLQSAKDFMGEAKRLNLTPVETTLAKVERPLMLGGPDPLEEAAFGLTTGGVSAPVKMPAGWVVLKSIESIPAGVPPMAEIRDKVVAAVKRQKAETLGLERAKQLAAEGKAGDLQAVGKKAGAQTGETTRFSRAKPAERLPGDAQLAALQTPAGDVTAPVKSPQGYYVLKVLERAAPSMAELPAERDRLSKEVLTQKQSQAWEAWISGARTNAKVETFAGATRTPRRS
jgi:peptidyl-prolyl cis-trans isomerase D